LKYYSKQHGAALIVALMVVALVAMLAITLGNDFMVATKRVQHQVYSQQAYTYLLGADGFARKWLLDDIKEDDNESDSEFDIWNAELDIPTDQGLLSGQLSDLQGRFNLNNLVGLKVLADGKYPPQQQGFIRLLQTLELEQELDEAAAEELSNALLDWLDDNDDERPEGGAESGYYSDNKPYSRVAGVAMMRVSELRMVKGFSAEIVKALSPYITVWPMDGDSKININTATLNVLRSLNTDNDLQPLNISDAQYIIEQRESEEGLVEKSAVFEKGSLKGRGIVTGGVGYTSDYFLLSTETLFLDQWFRLYSVIQRNTPEKTIRVVARNKINSF
jgi:general secretion pathway protein K